MHTRTRLVLTLVISLHLLCGCKADRTYSLEEEYFITAAKALNIDLSEDKYYVLLPMHEVCDGCKVKVVNLFSTAELQSACLVLVSSSPKNHSIYSKGLSLTDMQPNCIIQDPKGAFLNNGLLSAFPKLLKVEDKKLTYISDINESNFSEETAVLK